MSMQIDHIRSLAIGSLSMGVLVVCAGLASWLSLQSTPPPTGPHLVMHQALTSTLPSLPAQGGLDTAHGIERFLAGGDPFYRAPKEVRAVADNSQDPGLAEIHLSTIAAGRQGRYCIVNGAVFHEKQVGKGFIVKSIDQDKVSFETGLELFFLTPGQKVVLESGRLVRVGKRAVGKEASRLQGPILPGDKQKI